MKRVLACGSGDCGQLGLGEDVLTAERCKIIPFFDGKDVVSISAGGLHNLALTSTGVVYSWGCNDEKALGHCAPEWTIAQVGSTFDCGPVVKVACGDSISAALSHTGSVFTWGTFRDSQGVMGFDVNTTAQPCPTKMESISCKVVDISAGANHMVASGDSNTSSNNISLCEAATPSANCLLTWGCGEQGQLGRRILPRHKISGLRPENITPKRRRRQQKEDDVFVKVSCGSYHTLAITSNGSLFSWGLNNYGQLGLGHTDAQQLPTPVLMTESCHWTDIAAGEHHSLGLTNDGTVYGWGRDDDGQLGSSLPDGAVGGERASLAPIPINGFSSPVVQIACGGNHCLALDSNGSLYAWGYGGMGQLGTGDEEDLHIPTVIGFPKSVSSLKDFKIVQIQGGGQHSLVLVEHR